MAPAQFKTSVRLVLLLQINVCSQFKIFSQIEPFCELLNRLESETKLRIGFKRQRQVNGQNKTKFKQILQIHL